MRLACDLPSLALTMPTLNRRLLTWSDSDREDDDGGGGGTADILVEEARYGDLCASLVDDVLVQGSDGQCRRGGVSATPASSTRKVRTLGMHSSGRAESVHVLDRGRDSSWGLNS